MEFNQTKTFKNLTAAFAGECQAGMRYQMIAQKALMQGYKTLADEIKTIAKNETMHAKTFFDFILENGAACPNAEVAGGFPFEGDTVENGLIAALNAENALVLDELHPEVRAYLDAVKKALKTYFKVVAEDATAESIGQWIHEGSHPFGEDETAPDRKRFDSLALELSQKIESFSTMTPADHKIIFELLKRAMGTVPKGSLKDLLK